MENRYNPRPGVDAGWRPLSALLSVIGLAIMAQPFRPPEHPTPQQAYNQLLTLKSFAFGGIGYAGLTSEGEVDYHAIAGSTNALALFSSVLTNGTAEARLYALCGIRHFAPGKFRASAEPLRSANPKVETIQSCIVHHEFATKVISRISSGSYDLYLANANW
jgi:hypothetical protein